jgi:hypothetical protein
MRPVPLERVTEIPIIRRAVTQQLPAERNGNLFPRAVVEIGLVEIHGPLGRVRDVVELPIPIQAATERRVTALRQRLLEVGVRHERGVRRLFVDAETFGVFDFRRQRSLGLCDGRAAQNRELEED